MWITILGDENKNAHDSCLLTSFLMLILYIRYLLVSSKSKWRTVRQKLCKSFHIIIYTSFIMNWKTNRLYMRHWICLVLLLLNLTVVDWWSFWRILGILGILPGQNVFIWPVSWFKYLSVFIRALWFALMLNVTPHQEQKAGFALHSCDDKFISNIRYETWWRAEKHTS